MVHTVFIHLPKTAGTSFHEALCRGFGEQAVSPPFAASILSAEDAARLRKYQIVCGHISITDARQYFPNASLITILRDPVERCMSWYHFARRQGATPHADVNAAQQHGAEEFFTLGEDVVFRNIFNRQVRQLGGHALDPSINLPLALAAAKQTLAHCVWVGRQDNLAFDMVRLGEVFPEMKGQVAKFLNTAVEATRNQSISPLLRAKILRYNEYDMRLVSEHFAMEGAAQGAAAR